MSLLITLILFFKLISCRPTSQQRNGPDKAIEEYVDAILQPYLDSVKIAGAAVGIAKGDEIIFLKSYGYSDLEGKRPMPTDAIFQIASITKPFTAMAILQLAEKGLINLDDDIRDYLPFDTEGESVTVRQLLNHTSGIKDYTKSAIPNEVEGTDYPRDTLVQMLGKEPLDFEPGTAMSYSNSGYFILGLIIEKVSGMSYGEFLRENIFEEAKMQNTYLCGTTTTIEPGERAIGYNLNKQGELIKVTPGDFKWAFAAGALCSTAEDLLKWSIALNQSEKLLSKESYRAMTRPSKLNDSTEIPYGLGLQLNTYKGNKVLFHRGVMEGFLPDLRHFPETDLTVVTLLNTYGPVKPKDLSNSVASFFIEEKDIKQPFNGDLAPYVGTYSGKVMGRDLTRSFEAHENKLLINISGQKQPLDYIGDNKWVGEDGYVYSFSTGPKIKLQIIAPLMSIPFTKNE